MAAMGAGTSLEHTEHVHEAGIYGSDAEFRNLIVPFVEAGLAEGQPVIVGLNFRKADLVRSWLSDPAAVTFIADRRLASTPARAIATYLRYFESRVAMGAGQIRVAADVPYPGNGGPFDGWDRYEAAINTVWQEYPVWRRCVYDAAAPPEVLDVVERTHPHILSATGDRRASERFQDGAAFTALRAAPDSLEGSRPALRMVNPSALEVRRALARLGRRRLTGQVLRDLLIAASEAVTNATVHGKRPVTVRIWAGPRRIVVLVHDAGPGPRDPLAGLVPPPEDARKRELGLGLWIIQQLDIDVALIYDDDGFTVRLRAGAD